MSGPGPGRPRIVVVRHGETEWSRDGRHTGRTDVALTADGRRQAVLVGSRLRGRSFTVVLSSPLGRAAETARLAGLGDRIEFDADLAEWDYGAYEGRTTADIHGERPGWWLWTDGCPGGETAAGVAERADRVISRCLAAPGDSICVAHGHLLRVLAARWLGAAPELGSSLLLSTASVGVLGWEHDRPVVARWNDTGHLDGAAPLPA